MSLEPITPDKAVELYLDQRRNEVAEATIRSHRSRLGHFIEWCNEQDINNLNELTGRLLHEYRIWRRNDGGLTKASEKTQMDTLRVFIRWLETIEAVPQDLHIKIQSPTLSGSDNVRDSILTVEEAEKLLSYLRKYQYASIQHVTLTLLWHTMMRRGTARALDIEDYNSSEQYLTVNHRPESETPLKNQENGERFVALSTDVSELLNDWIKMNRPSVTDEYGRYPLLATAQGRIHATTIQQYVYQFTRPCIYTGSCPHGREIKSCEAIQRDAESKCPSGVSPHAVRRGGITHALEREIPEKAISDRADVGPEILEKHYDGRNEREKMEQRRQFIQ